ncbi:DUF2163 domain-containing protein [Novosphingobium bradum]|uniref:DUF2163 domain-containing protein n=1 Tax=Novosphingobium bradum TaxID=1737444 RepID=A0ABV7IUN3_9SPHN
MSRIWFSQELETTATFWRIYRHDGVALGFTTHDADLWADDLLHRAAPGMIPSAIRCSADLEPDNAEVDGALTHDAISEADLAAGRYDGARIVVGLIDWESAESQIIYDGSIGEISQDSGKFNATLRSRKADLQRDLIPRTSPTCRATFCGPDCGLSGARFTHRGTVATADPGANTVTVATTIDPAAFAGGELRWLDGPLAGTRATVVDCLGGALLLASPIEVAIAPGSQVLLREGCDRTLATCHGRFANAANFRGEPFLPGNDLVARYPVGP